MDFSNLMKTYFLWAIFGQFVLWNRQIRVIFEGFQTTLICFLYFNRTTIHNSVRRPNTHEYINRMSVGVVCSAGQRLQYRNESTRMARGLYCLSAVRTPAPVAGLSPSSRLLEPFVSFWQHNRKPHWAQINALLSPKSHQIGTPEIFSSGSVKLAASIRIVLKWDWDWWFFTSASVAGEVNVKSASLRFSRWIYLK